MRLLLRRLTRRARLLPWQQITPTHLRHKQPTRPVLRKPRLLTLLRPTQQMRLTVPESLTLPPRLKQREPKQLRLTPLRLTWSRRLIVQQSLTPQPKPTLIETKPLRLTRQPWRLQLPLTGLKRLTLLRKTMPARPTLTRRTKPKPTHYLRSTEPMSLTPPRRQPRLKAG